MNFKLFLLAVFLCSCISTDNVESYDLNNYRLPTWAFPAQYVLNIDLRWPEEDTFRGYTWININVTEENHYELVLNVDPLYIDVNTSVITVDTAGFICATVDFSNETQLMVLTCMYDMWGNLTQFAQFEMHYTAQFSKSAQGLYKNQYEINGATKTVFFTQFEPARFRKVFPSFDEPCYKAPILLSVDHYENLTVASNMLEKEDSNNINLGYHHSTFEFTPQMSTYLLAMVAGDTNDWEHTLISGTDNVWLFMQRIHEDYVSITTQNGPNLLNKMGEWTGIKYENLGNPKMTFAALPGMGGAMENWGLITFAEVYLIDEGDRTTSKSLIHSLSVMAHEISHQWFGDYVTVNWWSETWLNEGFATYFEWYLADMLSTDDNDYEFDKLFVTQVFQGALKDDGIFPLSNNDSNVNTPAEISSSFNVAIAYNKGGSVLRMLRYALGEDVFKKGIQEYLKAKALDNVKASDLLEHLQAALPITTDIDLPTYMDSWIHQIDYPIVKTSFSETDDDSYLITLDIYKSSPSLDEVHDQEQSIWWVPLSYITSNNPDPNNATYSWISPGKSSQFNIPKDDNSWGIVNAGATGFYRVDYDTQTLDRIIKVLNNSDTYTKVATENRAQLLDDLFNIAKIYTGTSGGYSERLYQDALTVAEYLKFETEYIPWYTFQQEAQDLLNVIQDDVTKARLKEDLLVLIEAQLVIPDPTDTTVYPHQEILKRNLLLDWASKLGQTDALTYVKTQYSNFLTDIKSIDSNYRDLVICYGIKTSTDPSKDYSTLMDLYSKSILPQERNDIILGASCMADSYLLKSYLETTLKDTKQIDKQYWADIFKAVCSRSPEGLDASLNFIVNHIDDISQKWEGVMSIEKLLSTVARKSVKQEHITTLRNLLFKDSLTPSLVQAVKGAIIMAEHNAKLADKMRTDITNVLQRRLNSK